MTREKGLDPRAQGSKGARETRSKGPGYSGTQKDAAAHGTNLVWRSSTFGEYLLRQDGTRL